MFGSILRPRFSVFNTPLMTLYISINAELLTPPIALLSSLIGFDNYGQECFNKYNRLPTLL